MCILPRSLNHLYKKGDGGRINFEVKYSIDFCIRQKISEFFFTVKNLLFSLLYFTFREKKFRYVTNPSISLLPVILWEQKLEKVAKGERKFIRWKVCLQIY